MKRILVYVQHLLGVGHLHRTALITSALARSGFSVTVINGGVPQTSVDFGPVDILQLDPIKTDAGFKALYDKDGAVIDDSFKKSRKNLLIKAVNQIKPDFVLVETYPFGRRQMRFELLPLLEHLKHGLEYRPLVASSIRDVIQPKSNPGRCQEIIAIVDSYFDYIFVHGDESFIAFEQTFPEATNFKEKIIYSGYVVKQLKNEPSGRREENKVLVSAGGGAVGEQIYSTVIDASTSRPGKQYNWHVLVGNNFSGAQFNKLRQSRHAQLIIERNRDDFLQLLSRCCMSISQAGYNTMMDLVVTNTPALVVPFEGVAEREQLIRAKVFEQHGMVKIIREKNLDSTSLLQAMTELSRHREPQIEIKYDGAQRMVEIIKQKMPI